MSEGEGGEGKGRAVKYLSRLVDLGVWRVVPGASCRGTKWGRKAKAVIGLCGGPGGAW